MADQVYETAAAQMCDREYERAAGRWTLEHDLQHTEDEWEALILRYAMEHKWSAVAGLARRALVMRIARPVEALREGGEDAAFRRLYE